MKIQCSCGAKYAFDVTPEMAQTPVRFVCPACGLDASDFVNSLVRQELGLPEPAATPGPAPVATPIQPAPRSPPVARVRAPHRKPRRRKQRRRSRTRRNAASSTRTNS